MINICHFLKLQIPILHRHFCEIISQNRKHVQTHCNDRSNLFRFACRKWYLDNQSP